MFPLSTFNSKVTNPDWPDIWSFVGRILTFLCPFLLVGFALEFALWKTGDLWSPQYALTHQQRSTQETIYGPRFFSDQFNIYKLSGIRYRQPSILAIGSSRVMQMRSIMFQPLATEFYNGGGLLRNAFDLEAVADMLIREELLLPKVLIVGIDPWWLRTQYGKTSWLHDSDERFSFAGHVEAFRQILKKGALTKFLAATSASKSPHFGYETIGTSARIDGTGFRKDGSSLYPPQVFLDFVKTPVYVDRESPAIIDRIRMTKREFRLPAIVDEKRVKLIIDALGYIQEKGVEVIAFMPPFSTEAYEALEGSAGLREWWTYYKHEFPKVLREHDIMVVPVSHPIQFDLDDTAMFDGWHPSEVYIAHLVKTLIRNAPNSSYLKNVSLIDLTTNIKNAAIPLAFDLPEGLSNASPN